MQQKWRGVPQGLTHLSTYHARFSTSEPFLFRSVHPLPPCSGKEVVIRKGKNNAGAILIGRMPIMLRSDR